MNIDELKKNIQVPKEDFEVWLEKRNWTYHQLARGEIPPPYDSLHAFQLGCIISDPVLWCTMCMRDQDDADKPWTFFGYQKESIRYKGNTLHECGAEVGKTREIIAFSLWKAFTVERGSGLITAPMFTHLIEIIDAILEQLSYQKEMEKALILHRKYPHHHMKFESGFTIDFRPTGYDGEALRGVHVKTFAMMDESAKAKNPDIFKEFWRATKPGCVHKLYSTPDGDRSSTFYKLCQKAEGKQKQAEDQAGKLARNLEFRKFHWSKTLMPPPFWTPERRRSYIDLYGGVDSPGYQQNVMGNWGDPENSLFPWHQFQRVLKDIPEYRCLKILIDEATSEVSIFGTKYAILNSQGENGRENKPQEVLLCDRRITTGEFDIRTEIKTFFSHIPGIKYGGADLGQSQDPTEIYVKLILGKTHRLIARLQLKHVTYDQQAEAIDALDEVFNDENGKMEWGLDAGNAGSAVVSVLKGQELYRKRNYIDRLTGHQFGSMHEVIDENKDVVIDKFTEKIAKLNAKELSSFILVKKMQRQELEYPCDPDIMLYYPNHTYRKGTHHFIFKDVDDHIIDADRVLTLQAHYMEYMGAGEIEFQSVGRRVAYGSGLKNFMR